MSGLIGIFRDLDLVVRDNVVLASGERSEFYVDVKKAYGHPIALNTMVDEMLRRFDERVTCVAAAGYGGLPLASAISSRANLKLVLARDEPKNHGLGGKIDGYFPSENDKIALIDDVFTSGGSLRKLIGALEQTKAEIVGAYVVVKRGEGNLSVPLDYLLKVEEIL